MCIFDIKSTFALRLFYFNAIHVPCVVVVVMSEKEVLERRIRIKKKKMRDAPVLLSSQQEETIQELLCGHRGTFDSAFYRFSGFRVCE